MISATSCGFVLDVFSVQVRFTAIGVPFGFLFCLIVVMLFLFLLPFLT